MEKLGNLTIRVFVEVESPYSSKPAVHQWIKVYSENVTQSEAKQIVSDFRATNTIHSLHAEYVIREIL